VNRHDRRAAASSTEGFCQDYKNEGGGLGCPNCKRFEVRSHPVDCAMHGPHLDLACCFCGTHFYSFVEVEHDHEHRPAPTRAALS
jgi:hypothetical protein